MSVIRRVAAGTVLCLATAALVMAPDAGAKSELHFFARDVSFKLTNAAGQPLAQGSKPTAGDRYTVEDVLYRGNHTSHADKVVGRARLSCVIRSADRALCSGRIVLRGGTLTAEHVIVRHFMSNTIVVEITGGTGEFAHAKGFARSVSVTDSTSDLTVVLR